MTELEALKLTLAALKQIDEAMPFPVAKLAIMEAEKALAQQCVCGEPNSAGTHRTDGPCLAPQRTLVGLTEDERTNIRAKVGEYTDFKRWDYTKRVQEATELALKEKNA